MDRSLEARIVRVVADVFGVPPEGISEDSSPDSIPGWDSLTHLNLLLALEKEFSVSLSPDNAMEMQSVRLIELILGEALPAAGQGGLG